MPQIKNKNFKNFEKTDVLCIYGQSSPDFNDQLKKWLKKKKNRKIIFLEDDIDKYKSLDDQISKIFKKREVKSIFIKDSLDLDLKKIAWDCVYLDLKVIKSPTDLRDSNFEKIENFLNEYHLGATLTSYIYSDFGINVFENFYSNLLNTDKFALFESMKDSCKNIPAIIAGAGPSIENDLDDLKKAYDKALIFTSGSSINIFSKNNIKYNFAASIDQNPYFKRFKNNHLFENNNIFFYQNQINRHNLSIVDGNKALVSDYGAYPLKGWIYERLGIKQDVFEAGWTVTTFLIKIATLLGCNPIIFVGLDLSYQKDKYAKGVTKDKSEYELIKIKDKKGEIVFTQKDWLLAKKWIEEFAKNKTTTFINASQSGLKIENVEESNLKALLKNLQNLQDLEGFTHTLYQNQEIIKLDKKKVIDVLTQIAKSLKKADFLCDEYMLEMEKNIFEDINLLKLQNEIVYIHLLDPIWQIWKPVIKREIPDDKMHLIINKLLFFKNVIFEHLKLIGQFL
ncbi:MAG: hypothetical protein K1000chlam1_00800 [Candidatus Anoxychlamydiales bacterium]|nr:hypothetical protein [Candidatus Anoxychlamydiales bacterium]